MKIKGEFRFDGPREDVWEVMRDPGVLAGALPGTRNLNQVSETEYEGRMHVRVGPVAGVFAGRLQVSNEVPPESFTLSVEGRGAPGFVNGSGDVRLLDQSDNTTLVRYTGEVHVGGTLAGVGQRLMESVSKSIIRQGLESMNGALRARLEPESDAVPAGEAMPEAAAPAAAYRGPSESEFAATVARDVLRDLATETLTPENQVLLITGLVAVLSVLVGFWLGRLSRRN